MDFSFWKDKHVFLTGHTGFKGSWLSLWLQQLGANITGYSLGPPTSPSLFELAGVKDKMASVFGDICDKSHLGETMLTCKPEIVIHMAAQPLVRMSYLDPVSTFETNVIGTVNILEVARHTPSVKAIVNVTTDKCYENKEWLWGYKEQDRLGGHDPYSSSKACAELISSSYRDSFFNRSNSKIAMATARAGNVIGGGDWAKDRLMTDLISALQKDEEVEIRNPNATRPWQHVLEPIRGYLMLAERLYLDGDKYSEPWNFGPREEDVKSVSWIVDELSSHWKKAKLSNKVGSHPHEAQSLKLDISKAKARLGWSPIFCVKEAISLTADWSIKLQKGISAKDITVDQIISYQKLLKLNEQS